MKNAHPFRRLMQTLPAVLLSATVLFSSHHTFAKECAKPDVGLSYRQVSEKYEVLDCLHRGLAYARLRTGEEMYVDKSGNPVFTFPKNVTAKNRPVDPEYYDSDIEFFLEYDLIWIRANDGWKHGLIDKTGKIILPPKFDSKLMVVSKGKTILAGIKLRNDFLYDYQGNLLFEASSIGYPVEEMMQFGEYSRDKRTGYGQTKYGFINTAGEVVVPAKYYEVEDFSNGLAIVKEWSNNQPFCGYIDKTGTVVIPIEYSSCKSFKNGVASVGQGNDSFYINKQGKRVEKPQAKSNGSKGKKKKK